MSERELKPEQAAAINYNGGNLLVSASAGSGKTFVMIQRLIRLIVEKKAHVDEILAATFTEAAASDMKEKLKRALLEEIENGKTALAVELTRVSTADICTLHAFCGKLIRTYFFAAGVSPDFKVADESEAAALKLESLEETFKSFYSEKDEKVLALIDRYRAHRKDDALCGIVMRAYGFCESELNPDRLLLAFRDNYTEKGAETFLNDYENRLKSAVKILSAELINLKHDCNLAHFSAGEKLCDEFLNIAAKIEGGGTLAARELAENSALPVMTRSKAPEGKEDLKVRLKTAKARLKSLCDYSVNVVADNSILAGLTESAETLYRLIKRFSEKYAALKLENNLLDFADLERFALKALKDESVKKSVREKYKYVFVDEYQDVNPVQEEIISMVSGDNLFMVGDVKQSIYGFRGCRAEIFENKEQTVKNSGGAAIGLNYNFRSADNVIDFINEIFDFCYVPLYTGLDYKGKARLFCGGIYPENAKGRAELHHLVKEKKEREERPAPHLYNILDEAFCEEEKEAANVSNLLTEIIESEQSKEFYDLKTKSFRPVRLQDIAILTRAGDSAYVKGIVEGLSGHGIRVVSNVSQNACDFPEIKTLINVLKLLDCFYLDVPLVNTLLSPVGGFSEEELADVALFFKGENHRGGFSDAFKYYLEKADTPLKDKLGQFKNKFEEYRTLADFKGAKGILDKIIADSGYENYLLCTDGGDEKIFRLYKFLAEAESGGKTRTVREFLRKIETSPQAFECAGGGDEDAVKVMTIHSSKGLEFPVVIVCGLEKNFSRRDETNPVMFNRDKGLFTYAFDDEKRTVLPNFYREVVKSGARETQIKEEMRLFYVALTRAAYSLHLVFEKSADERKGEFSKLFTENACFLDFVPNTIAATQHLTKSFGLTSAMRKRRQVLVAKVDEAAKDKMIKDFAFLYPYQAATVLPLKNSVSVAIRREKEEFYPVYSLFAEDHATDREKGVIAHKILEHYDFNGVFDEQIIDMRKKGILSDEELKKVDTKRLKNVVESGAFSGVKDKTLFREQPFIVNISANRIFDTDSDEEVLLQGVIDLLAVFGDTAEIIDYKYSVLNAESLKRKYAAQLDLYAYAVERALNIKVISKTLVNVFTGEIVKVN